MQFFGLRWYSPATSWLKAPEKGGALPRLGFLSADPVPRHSDVSDADPPLRQPEELGEKVCTVPTAAHADADAPATSRLETHRMKPMKPAEIDTVAFFHQQERSVQDLSAIRHVRLAVAPTTSACVPPDDDAKVRQRERALLLRKIRAKDMELGQLLAATMPLGNCREMDGEVGAEHQAACVAV
eukprot:GGOE01055074.1.p4 GENE.GGOE01055074.1~~GGOE01055074.1.p4  ORF type:complete len:184 (-),score=49.31 GGOE01055074.1:1433-1984(-)